MLDAIGSGIHHISLVHKYAREEDRPEKTLFVITTDGMENASRRYSYEKVRKMIQHEQEKYGWEFLFIGANIDAIQEAGRFGIRRERAVNYVHDRIGTQTVYEAVGNAVTAMRCAKSAEMCAEALDNSAWDEVINIDYECRSNRF